MDRGAWWATVHGVAKTEKLIHKKGIVDQNIDYIQAYLPFQRIYGGKKAPHQRPHLFFIRWWVFQSAVSNQDTQRLSEGCRHF